VSPLANKRYKKNNKLRKGKKIIKTQNPDLPKSCNLLTRKEKHRNHIEKYKTPAITITKIENPRSLPFGKKFNVPM